MGLGGVITFSNAPDTQQVNRLRSDGYTEPVFAVEAYNTGRGATSIIDIDLSFDDGGAVRMTQPNPPLPFRLEGESAETWYIDARLAMAYATATGQQRIARGRVVLGSKKVVRSKNEIPIPIG
jgi:hypothetical protein